MMSLLTKEVGKVYQEITGAMEEKIFGQDMKWWLKKALEKSMEIEIQEELEVERYQRSPQRKDYLNGFYERSLDTVFGWIAALSVPRVRWGKYQPKAFGRYARRQMAINRLIAECYWRGVSTRDVKHVLKALCEVEVSSSTVSSIPKEWQQEAGRWHNRRIADEYMYLFLDGVWIKNRSLGKTKRLVLVAYGIKGDGRREIIDYQFSVTESQDHWERFLNALYHRGLQGKHLQLVVTDGCYGLWNALDMVFPRVPHQLCLAHKMRNILKTVPKAKQTEVHEGLKPIVSRETKDKRQAEAIVRSWMLKWKDAMPPCRTMLGEAGCICCR
jgi:transposase-like protein